MGRRKFRLGRVRKNTEKQRQALGINKPGRPKKHLKCHSDIDSDQLPQAVVAIAKPMAQFNSPQGCPTCPLKHLYESLSPLGNSWSVQYSNQLQLCKLNTLPSTSSQPLVITYTITIHSDCSWLVFVHGNCLHNVADTPLSGIPCKLDSSSLHQLICAIDDSQICPGNPDDNFVTMVAARKGQLLSPSGRVVARLEENFIVEMHGNTYNRTVQTKSCALLVGKGEIHCGSCRAYRCQLRAMHSRWSKKANNASQFSNNRYLNTPHET